MLRKAVSDPFPGDFLIYASPLSFLLPLLEVGFSLHSCGWLLPAWPGVVSLAKGAQKTRCLNLLK